MKKLMWFLMMLALFTMPIVVFAQESPPGTENPISLAMFADLTLLAAGIVAITAVVKKLLNTNGLITDIVSWVLGPILGIIGWYFKLGMFVDIMWYMAVLYGLLAAFYANKGWDLGSVLLGAKNTDYKKLA